MKKYLLLIIFILFVPPQEAKAASGYCAETTVLDYHVCAGIPEFRDGAYTCPKLKNPNPINNTYECTSADGKCQTTEGVCSTNDNCEPNANNSACVCSSSPGSCWVNATPTPGGGGGGGGATPTPTTPSCTVTVNVSSANDYSGKKALTDGTRQYEAAITLSGGAVVDRVEWAVQRNNGTWAQENSVVALNKTSDNSSPYRVLATGKTAGQSEIRGRVFLNGVSGFACGNREVFNVYSPSCTASFVAAPDIAAGSQEYVIGYSDFSILNSSNVDVGSTFSLWNPFNLGTMSLTADPPGRVTITGPTVVGGTLNYFTVTGNSSGPVSYTATINGASKISPYNSATLPLTCATSTASASVISPNAWWQVAGADVWAKGSITSSIPDTCALPGCNSSFDLDGVGGFPGVPVYATSYDFSLGIGDSGVASSKGWLANASYRGQSFGFTYFDQLSRSVDEASWNNISSLDQGVIDGATLVGGYTWLRYNGASGDLTLTGPITISGGKKVILFVENAGLIVGGDIAIDAPGTDFFMAIVDTDMTIDPAVSTLDGLYVVDGTFDAGGTGTGDVQLTVSGTVSALGGVTLNRNLVDNSVTPAEIFNYSPGLLLAYPSELVSRNIKWKEVAP